jgi:hypothetical protein
LSCGENPEHCDTRHDEQPNLQRTQTRFGIDANRLGDLSRAAVVLSNAICSLSLLIKFMLSRYRLETSSDVSLGFAAMLARMAALNRPTRSAPATAVPTASARFWVVPRNDPTSPASFFGEAVTSTLNNSVTRALADAEYH